MKNITSPPTLCPTHRSPLTPHPSRKRTYKAYRISSRTSSTTAIIQRQQQKKKMNKSRTIFAAVFLAAGRVGRELLQQTPSKKKKENLPPNSTKKFATPPRLLSSITWAKVFSGWLFFFFLFARKGSHTRIYCIYREVQPLSCFNADRGSYCCERD